MSIEVLTNGLICDASTSYTSGATAITVSVDGFSPVAAIPLLTAGQSMRFSWDGEIVIVTANSGTGNVNWTISRGQEGTTAIAHASGSQLFQITTTAGLAQTIQDGCGLVQLGEVVLSGTQATITFNNIPQTYRNLFLTAHARGDTGSSPNLFIRFNNDSTSGHYAHEYVLSSGGVISGSQTLSESGTFLTNIPGSSDLANAAGVCQCRIFNYTNSAFLKHGISHGYSIPGAALTNHQLIMVSQYWNQTSAITRIDLYLSSGSFISGSVFTLWGEK